MLAGLPACKKGTWLQPVFIAQYTANGTPYYKQADYNTNAAGYAITPVTDIATIGNNNDSITRRYGSSLVDANGLNSITVYIVKKFHRNQLDSITNGYRIKNENDFYNLFKAGNIGVYNTPAGPTACIDIAIRDTGEYVFNPPQFATPVPAGQDTANGFEITNSTTAINFIGIEGLPTLVPLKLIMVTIRFKCRLYNMSSVHNERIFTDGIYQGYFADY